MKSEKKNVTGSRSGVRRRALIFEIDTFEDPSWATYHIDHVVQKPEGRLLQQLIREGRLFHVLSQRVLGLFDGGRIWVSHFRELTSAINFAPIYTISSSKLLRHLENPR